MVARISLGFACIDAIYAAGLGLLLGVLFTCVRMLLPKGPAFAFICDFAVLVLGGMLYSSIAVSRFYSGVARWYTVLALVLGYLSWQIAAHAKLVYVAGMAKFALIFPFFTLWQKFLKQPIVKLFIIISQKTKKHKENTIKKRTKRIKQLQKASQVLYNSR